MSDVADRGLRSRHGTLCRTLAAATLSLLVTSTSLSASASAATPRSCPAGGELVYVGTQASEPGQGIFAARLDRRTGKLTPVGLAAEVQRPTWLTPHPALPIIYAVSEVGNDGKSQGSVLTFQADPKTGLLNKVGAVPSGGGGPTHLAVDLPTRTVLVANYGTGQVAALPILADGSLGAPRSVQADQGSGPSPRQKGPHAHAVTLDPSRKFALVADLGADRIFIYPYDRATHQLGAMPTIEALPAGQGPRRLAFHPNGRFVFLLSELIPELRAYLWDAQKGKLHLTQTVATAADPAHADKAKGAELVVSPDGRFVYVSIRGEDVLVAYAVNPRTGALREVQRVAANGLLPWSFGLEPGGRWLLVANQGSNAVQVFARDPASGKLTATSESITVNKPVSVAYLQGGCR
jgi:6-phosphogluconolactonase